MKTYTATVRNERHVGVACNLCGSQDRKLYLRIRTGTDFVDFIRCVECGLVYQYPQPHSEDLRKRYGQHYFEYEYENEENFFHLMRLGLKDIDFHGRSLHFKSKRFLDIGCATGMLLAYMKKRGWNAQGVEICRASATYGMNMRDLNIYIGTLEEAAFAQDSFTVVHFSHLIEHLPHPKRFLREVMRVLVAGGFAVITTPNVDGLQAKLLKGEWRSAIGDHLYLFSKKTLRKMLVAVGFKVLDVVTWGGIAVGHAPVLIKKPLDRLAKQFGFGDVVLFLVQKEVKSA